ncbi:hypothetical protein NC653_039477 [Populus alba x Populus x berolinensis]|nr:hypothetical protein NC653_039477 [Populus alba x Populus x berolinensis]
MSFRDILKLEPFAASYVGVQSTYISWSSKSLVNSRIVSVYIFMPKKSSSKKPTQEQENADVQQAKPSSTPEKSGNEIDDIFSGKKRKKPEQIKADKANVNGEEKPKSMKKKKKSKEDEERRFTDPPSKSRKKTEDGFSVYTEEELGFNNSSGGGTPLCPFDCDCCF